MPRKKTSVKGGNALARIKENSRLMSTHESMVDYLSGRRCATSFLDVFTSNLFGLDFFRSIDDDLEYDDDDDVYSDDEDEEDDYFYPHDVSPRTLEPHPRIRQLTDEEADKHTKELIEEEERRKERTNRNKRKKLRKKEKKRLEKENAVKEEEQRKSSENKEGNLNTNYAEANDPPESSKTQNVAEAAGCDERSGKDINTTEEKEKDLLLENSHSPPAKAPPEETSNQRPAKARKKEKAKQSEVKQPQEEKPKVTDEPEVKKKEQKSQQNEESAVDRMAEELARRSREMAGVGNRLAASGQYEMAVKYFTDAIKHNPKEFKLFGNRSLCYERMQQYENALRDADLALCMEPNWIKGLFRKGKALCGLKRYYDASLIYTEVLQLDGSSAEAAQELKRAQTLHLMEMGFSWAQSCNALKAHGTLEEAIESLFGENNSEGASRAAAPPPPVEDDCEGEWTVLQTSRPKQQQQIRAFDALDQSRDLYSVWIGSMAPAVTYATLHELFSRAGTVYSIKLLLEHQCAFVNYTRKEDCERAIQCIDGLVVEGAPLTVRHPTKIYTGNLLKTECFFWRTTGCTRPDCTYKHDPEHKNIDREKFTSRLGNFHM